MNDKKDFAEYFKPSIYFEISKLRSQEQSKSSKHQFNNENVFESSFDFDFIHNEFENYFEAICFLFQNVKVNRSNNKDKFVY